MNYKITQMTPDDWKDVSNIYLEGIRTGRATFQCQVPTWEEWDSAHTSPCRLVARKEDLVLGWVALTPVSGRCVYKGVASVSIYIGEDYKGQGIGTALLQEVAKQSEEEGFWTLESGIIIENTGSIALHKKCGFREVGIREKIAKTVDGKWMDVMVMERRSRVVNSNQ